MPYAERTQAYQHVKELLEEERSRLDAAIQAIDRLLTPQVRAASHGPLQRARTATPPRGPLKQSILALLEADGRPVTTSDIARTLKAQGFPRTSYASVYNTLARIARSGDQVVKLGNAWQALRKPSATRHAG